MRLRSIGAIALVLFAACGGDTTAPTDTPFAGTYTLQTINGQGLPFVFFQQGQNSVTIINDHLTLADGGTWSETMNYRTVNNGATTTNTLANAGSWIRSGNGLVLISGSSQTAAYSGTFDASRLMLADQGLAFVFAK